MNTFELHIAVCPQLSMPRKRISRQYASTAGYDETMINVYDIIERIESGNVNLGASGFRVCIDGICYVRCIYKGGEFMVVHAYRTADEITDVIKVDIAGRCNIFTSAFRSCMLNIDHAIKLIKLRLINIKSYCIIVDKVYNNDEYYYATLPRFEPYCYRDRTRLLIKYIMAARMHVDGMSIKEINELLHHDFSRGMKLITE